MLENLSKRINAKSRSICAENMTGEKGKGAATPLENGSMRHAASELGEKWKVNPFITVQPGETQTFAHIKTSGTIKHIWITPKGDPRLLILRIYFEGQNQPSVECPLSDFFATVPGEFRQINSLPVCVNPGSAYNCYWDMPFHSECRMTIENLNSEAIIFFYQVDYFEEAHDDEILYFHAQFRRVNPLPYKQEYVILDGVKGRGHYVGTYMLWGSHNNRWWGEGEIKFYLDGDDEYPTICGTGTEDYFCGSYNFENKALHCYQEFSSPYTGLPTVVKPDGLYKSQQRFGMYRWHIVDPIIFEEDLKVTIQALGWRRDKKFLPLQDDISSVAYWYQTLPAAEFPEFPGVDELELI